MLPKAIYRFNTIPIKFPMMYFTEPEQKCQKFTWNHKRPHIATAILRKKKKVGGIMPFNIRLYYKAIVVKIAWYWHKTDIQFNGVEQNPEINAHLYSQYLTEEASTYNGVKVDYLINDVGENGQRCAEK